MLDINFNVVEKVVIRKFDCFIHQSYTAFREIYFIFSVTSTFCCRIFYFSNFYQVPKPKSKLIKGDQAEQEKLEMLACDRQSQSGKKNKYWNSF